jgi:hypothetical protein
MAISNKIRVGIVGVSPNRGFASTAHIPALQALPEFEISAVCTTRQDSAEASAVTERYALTGCRLTDGEIELNPGVEKRLKKLAVRQRRRRN